MRRIVICRDDDKPHSPADLRLGRVVAAWREAGVDAVVATPWPVRRGDGSDMATVIYELSPDAVLARIVTALGGSTAPIERATVHDAGELVAAAVEAFFARLAAPAGHVTLGDFTMPLAPAPFAHGIKVSVGVGKSHHALGGGARALTAMREAGDGRVIVITVPTLALADALAWRFRGLPGAAGLVVRVWRGRDAFDPNHSDYTNPSVPDVDKAKMCAEPDRVQDAIDAGLSVQQSACKRTIKGDVFECPSFYACSYQKQKTHSADLWIVTPEMLFQQTPDNFGEVAAVVVDESVYSKGLVGESGQHLTVSLDTLSEPLPDARLMDLRRQLRDAICDLPDGPVPRAAFATSLLTADSVAEAIKIEWSRKVSTLQPGMSKEQRREAVKLAAGNRTVERMVLVWEAVAALLTPGGPDASGWLALATEATNNGSARVLRVKGRKRIADGWQAPTLLLDAGLQVPLVQHYWPDIELVADIDAAAPHQRVFQVTDKAYAKSMLDVVGIDADEIEKQRRAGSMTDAEADKQLAEKQRRANRLDDLRAIIVREACRYLPNGKVLVVLQKSVKEALLALGPLPPNVCTAHHNNIAGRDDWRDVALLIVVGRTMPNPGAVERIAEALTGRAVPAIPGWHERHDATREMQDGSTIAAEADRHPDPVAELIRWQIAEGEMIQIIGRARGCNRKANDPVTVLALTALPVPLPLAGTLSARELDPSPADRMIAAGGIAFENARHAFAAYPGLWDSHKAAAKAMEREEAAKRERSGRVPTKG